jgi:predicted anti-sigma-YlaC factor YlaD
MSCDEFKPLLSGYLDKELTPEESIRLKEHLSTCSACRSELHQFEELMKVTGSMKPVQVPDRFWDIYWHGIYNRLERGVGWVLFAAGAAILIGYGLWHFVQALLTDQSTPLILRVGLGLGAAGLGVLLWSLLRERWIMRKKDPYREVQR